MQQGLALSASPSETFDAVDRSTAAPLLVDAPPQLSAAASEAGELAPDVLGPARPPGRPPSISGSMLVGENQ